MPLPFRSLRENPGFAGKLIASPGDRADQVTIRAEGLAQCHNLSLQIVLLNHPVRPHARHQHVFANNGSLGLDQHHQHIEGASAELDGPAIGEQLATMWQ